MLKNNLSLQKLVKSLMGVMQKKAKRLKWSIDGNPKNITLTLSWNIKRSLPFGIFTTMQETKQARCKKRTKRRKAVAAKTLNNNDFAINENTRQVLRSSDTIKNSTEATTLSSAATERYSVTKQSSATDSLASESDTGTIIALSPSKTPLPFIDLPPNDEKANDSYADHQNSPYELPPPPHGLNDYCCNSGISMLDGLIDNSFLAADTDFNIDDLPLPSLFADENHSDSCDGDDSHRSGDQILRNDLNKCRVSDQLSNMLALPDLVAKPVAEVLPSSSSSNNRPTYDNHDECTKPSSRRSSLTMEESSITPLENQFTTNSACSDDDNDEKRVSPNHHQCEMRKNSSSSDEKIARKSPETQHVYPEIIVQTSDVSTSNESTPVTRSMDDLLSSKRVKANNVKSSSSVDKFPLQSTVDDEGHYHCLDDTTRRVHHNNNRASGRNKRKQISWSDEPDKWPSPISNYYNEIDAESDDRAVHQCNKSDTSTEMPEWSDLELSFYQDQQRDLLSASPMRIMYVSRSRHQGAGHSDTSPVAFKRKNRYRDSFKKLFPFHKKSSKSQTPPPVPPKIQKDSSLKRDSKSNSYISYDYDSLPSDTSSLKSESASSSIVMTPQKDDPGQNGAYQRVKEYQRIKTTQKLQSLARRDSVRRLSQQEAQPDNVESCSTSQTDNRSGEKIPLSVDKCLKTCDKILDRHSTMIW
ncbi:uncharacterized protein LOC141899138 [Tubulanus polymorphus]|uniref:uncharacterized protein LOC141899138 n=1 Tax=Tubulanus polymorphus TaxID=672921 RepID=UPI003DA5003A